MMSVKNDCLASSFLVFCATFLASKIISFKNHLSKLSINRKITKSSFVPFPISMIGTRFNPIWVKVFFKSFIPSGDTKLRFSPFFLKARVVSKAVINICKSAIGPFVSLSMPLPCYAWRSLSGKPFIPRGSSSTSSLGKVTSNIIWFIFLLIFNAYPSRCEATASAFTHLRISESNCSTHVNIVPQRYAESLEKSGELLESPNVKTRAISSQATMERLVEGSTTMRVSPNNNPSHECPTRKGRYSLSIMDNMMKHDLNGHAITNLNSIPLTQKVQNLSRFDIDKILRDGLMDDMVKCLDGLAERQFNKTKLRYVGSSASTYALTTNGTTTTVATSALNTYHLRKMILELTKRNVPGWQKAGGGYTLIASHEAAEGLLGALESVYQYTEAGVSRLFAGEIGKYFDTRVVADGYASRFIYNSTARTSTSIQAASTTDGYVSTAWSAAANVLSGPAYLFGSPTVMEAIAVQEEIRAKEITDYGRSHGIAWYYLGGFQLVWDDAANSRIIKWDSA